MAHITRVSVFLSLFSCLAHLTYQASVGDEGGCPIAAGSPDNLFGPLCKNVVEDSLGLLWVCNAGDYVCSDDFESEPNRPQLEEAWNGNFTSLGCRWFIPQVDRDMIQQNRAVDSFQQYAQFDTWWGGHGALKCFPTTRECVGSDGDRTRNLEDCGEWSSVFDDEHLRDFPRTSICSGFDCGERVVPRSLVYANSFTPLLIGFVQCAPGYKRASEQPLVTPHGMVGLSNTFKQHLCEECITPGFIRSDFGTGCGLNPETSAFLDSTQVQERTEYECNSLVWAECIDLNRDDLCNIQGGVECNGRGTCTETAEDIIIPLADPRCPLSVGGFAQGSPYIRIKLNGHLPESYLTPPLLPQDGYEAFDQQVFDDEVCIIDKAYFCECDLGFVDDSQDTLERCGLTTCETNGLPCTLDTAAFDGIECLPVTNPASKQANLWGCQCPSPKSGQVGTSFCGSDFSTCLADTGELCSTNGLCE